MDAGRADKDLRISFMQRALDASSHAYKLAGLLCWRYGNKNGAIFPSQETLARDLGLTDRHVRRVLKELVPFGLRIDIRRGPRSGKSMSFYSFDGPIIPDMGVRNTGNNSGHGGPESSNATATLHETFQGNSGHLRHEFRTFEHQNSGHPCPPNQKKDPKERTIYPPSPLKGEQRASALHAETQTAKKRVEQELSSWMDEGRLDEGEANKVRTAVAELLDGYAAGDATRGEVEAAYSKIRGVVLKRPPVPSVGKAERGSPGKPGSDGLPRPPVSPEASPAPDRPSNGKSPQRPANGSAGGSVTDVIPLAAQPTSPKAPGPSRPRKPKLTAGEQLNRDIRKSAIWRDCHQGRITMEEADRMVAAIDAAAPEACGAA
jgi:Helix-turn-helix domain